MFVSKLYVELQMSPFEIVKGCFVGFSSTNSK